MGIIVSFRCQCGYDSGNLPMGCGLRFPETGYNGIPAYCPECKEVVLVHYTDPAETRRPKMENNEFEHGICHECSHPVRFYDDPDLSTSADGDEQGGYIRWGSFTMPEKRLFCPRCNEMTMRCIDHGCWD